MDGNAGGGDDFGAGAGKGFGAEAGVVADADAFGGVFVLGAGAGVEIGGYGLGGDADIGEGEVVGDEAAPAVGAEFDLRMGHGWVSSLPEEIRIKEDCGRVA